LVALCAFSMAAVEGGQLFVSKLANLLGLQNAYLVEFLSCFQALIVFLIEDHHQLLKQNCLVVISEAVLKNFAVSLNCGL
jgi:hypothetical protein